MISIKNPSPSQINRSFDEVTKETIDAYNNRIKLLNDDTNRVLKLIDSLISYRTAQLMLLESL